MTARLLLGLLAALVVPVAACREPAPAPAARASEPSPAGSDESLETSLFLLDVALEDEAGAPFALANERGHPVLVAFFYASCTTACPLAISEIRAMEAALAPEARAALRVVLVTLDPERDDALRLLEVATERDLPLERWSLVRANEHDLRTLASTMGVTYRRTPDGEIAHGTIYTLLDGEGRVIEQSAEAGRGLEGIGEAIGRER